MPGDGSRAVQELDQAPNHANQEDEFDQEEDAAEIASKMAFMKHGKPKRAPLIKGHTKKIFDSAEYFKQKSLEQLRKKDEE